MKTNTVITENNRTKGTWDFKQTRGNNEYDHRIFCGETHIADMCDENTKEEIKANAAYIVKAVNSHEELVRIIDKILAIGALERVERFDVLEDAKAILEKVNANT